MEVKTMLSTGNNIANPSKSDIDTHEIRGACPFCRRNISYPIPGNMLDYKSLYAEMKERFVEAAKSNGDHLRQNATLISKVRGLIALLGEMGSTLGL